MKRLPIICDRTSYTIVPKKIEFERSPTIANRISFKTDSTEIFKTHENAVRGELYFSPNRSDDEMCPFMILPPNADVKDVLKKFKTCWNLDNPHIGLFIMSDPDRRCAWKDARNINALVSGLLREIHTMKMWLFTNGLNAGLTMEIGNKFRQELHRRQESYPLILEAYSGGGALTESKPLQSKGVLIGACSYSSVTYAQKLESSSHAIRVDNGNHVYTEGQYDLNPNHTHYVLLKKDSAAVNDFLFQLAGEMANELEYHSSAQLTSSGAHRIQISEVFVVALLIHGNMKLLSAIQKHLDRKLPIIIIKGSGGLADLLAFFYHEIENIPKGSDRIGYMEDVLKLQVREKIASLFPGIDTSPATYNIIYDRLMQCIMIHAHKDLFTVLDTTNNTCKLDRLPEYVLTSLFKSKIISGLTRNKILYMRQYLNLAMDWNCPDVGLDEMFACNINIKDIVNEDLFVKALIKPRCEKFIEVFLKHGFKIREILSSKLLILLFNQSKSEQFFQRIVLERIMGLDADVQITREFLDDKLAHYVYIFTGLKSFIQTNNLDQIVYSSFYQRENRLAEEKALIIIIIWAAFTFRLRLLNVLWKVSAESMRLAIFISMLLKKINKHVHEISLKILMKKQHVMFSKHGIELLDLYYKNVPSRAFYFIQEKNYLWCYKNVMELAASANNKYFLSHPCCQRYLDDIFMGQIRLRESYRAYGGPAWVKITLSAFLIIPMYFWVSFYTSIDELTDYNIGIRTHEETYENHKYTAFGTRTSIKEELISEKPNYYPDDRDDAYFYRPVLHVKEIYPLFFEKVYYMWSAPITKFCAYHTVHICYIAFFSVALLWPGCGNVKIDIILILWTALIIINKLFDACRLRHDENYFSVNWDLSRCIILLSFLCVYAVCRFNTHNRILPIVMRCIMSTVLLYLYYRLAWSILPISSSVGTLMYRVKRMILVDFISYMRISLIVLVSNAVVLQTLIFPSETAVEKVVTNTFRRICETIFFLPNIIEFSRQTDCLTVSQYIDNCTNNEIYEKHTRTCPYYNGIWPYLFIILCGILFSMLLWNTLRAMFAETHRKIQQESEQIWKYNRYKIVVEFQDKILPFPLSIFKYVSLLRESLLNLYKTKKTHSLTTPKLPLARFSIFHYVGEEYYSGLRQEYYITLQKGGNTQLMEEMEKMEDLSEKLHNQKRLVTELQRHVINLQAGLNYTNKYLSEDFVEEKTMKYQILSRLSPYPNTHIKRYPVPDHRVPWNKDWTIYDPPVFSLSTEQFPFNIRDFVDEDVQLWMQVSEKKILWPKYLWNETILTVSGLLIDRQSWIIDETGIPIAYSLNIENLPLNPLGRTGLRGKGYLPRWGPNHFIYVFISMPCSIDSSRQIKFLAKTYTTQQEIEQISLPGGFVMSKDKYFIIQQFFNSPELKWKSPEDMFSFFASCVSEFTEVHKTVNDLVSLVSSDNRHEIFDMIQYRLVKRGYMDDPLNTDQAWKEFEFWHIHFDQIANLEPKLSTKLKWLILNEEVLSKLHCEFSKRIKKIVSSMEIVL